MNSNEMALLSYEAVQAFLMMVMDDNQIIHKYK
jgi:hypothetical protein